MKTKVFLGWIVLLFVLDLAIKIVIDRYFLDVNFAIIPLVFYFKSTFNAEYSWINGLFGLGMGYWTHVVILCFVTLLMIFGYHFMKIASCNAKFIDITFIFGFAGAACGSIGTIFWNGCLDYIYLKPLFVFYLKDLYIDCFVVLLLVYCYKNKRHLDTFKSKDIINLIKSSLQSKTKNQKSKIEHEY